MCKTGLTWLTWLTWLTGLTELTGLTRLTIIAPYYSILVDATGPEPIFKWTDGSPKTISKQTDTILSLSLYRIIQNS